MLQDGPGASVGTRQQEPILGRVTVPHDCSHWLFFDGVDEMGVSGSGDLQRRKNNEPRGLMPKEA